MLILAVFSWVIMAKLIHTSSACESRLFIYCCVCLWLHHNSYNLASEQISCHRKNVTMKIRDLRLENFREFSGILNRFKTGKFEEIYWIGIRDFKIGKFEEICWNGNQWLEWDIWGYLLESMGIRDLRQGNLRKFVGMGIRTLRFEHFRKWPLSLRII